MGVGIVGESLCALRALCDLRGRKTFLGRANIRTVSRAAFSSEKGVS
jgi:hypothetical protein